MRAYLTGAETIRNLSSPIHELLDSEGIGRLRLLPGIGQSLERTIDRLVRTDHLGLLDRLRGEWGAEDVFATVPGIGVELARRIHQELGIEALMELEAAANDGSLTRVPGVGRCRLLAVRKSLAGRFRRRPRIPEPRRRHEVPRAPPVSELLDVDREYFTQARKGRLPRTLDDVVRASSSATPLRQARRVPS